MLNLKYYKNLVVKYVGAYEKSKFPLLVSSMILQNYRKQNVHFNIPNNEDVIAEVINRLYNELAFFAFAEFADLPQLKVGDKWKKKYGGKKEIYRISKIVENCYSLTNTKDTSLIISGIKYDSLLTKYIPVNQNSQERTIKKYEDFFRSKNTHGFLPTNFSKKILFVGKSVWDKLENKNKIPTTYLPNTREENDNSPKKSMPALTDCMIHVLPKYSVCYEQIFQKGIAIDTIVFCGADESSIQQLLQDQKTYNFKAILLSNSHTLTTTNLQCWNWFKEEINLINEKSDAKEIKVEVIQDPLLTEKLQNFEACIDSISQLEYPVKLVSYPYFLRLGLNTMQPDIFDYLINRLKNNRELENNEAGYSMEYLGSNNPKTALLDLLSHLKTNLPKRKKIRDFVKIKNKSIIVADRNDLDFLSTDSQIKQNQKLRFFTHKELKREVKADNLKNKPLVFYTFNGSKDFDFMYQLRNEVFLILYEQEFAFYQKQFQQYKQKLEAEIVGEHRFKLCGIKYEPLQDKPIQVSTSLESIIQRLDESSNIAYDGYKEEADSILDDLEEHLTYELLFANAPSIQLESNETVFDEKGKLIKVYQLKQNDRVRIYPKEQLAENLFQIAVETEPDIFGKVEEHAQIWLDTLKSLNSKYPNREILYTKLKAKGLKVLPATVDSYFHGHRKFPMYNTDLRAIIELSDNRTLIDTIPQILKSKRLYNSTMIALGRGIKQELGQFFKENKLGEILQKRKFTFETLRQFTETKMPLLVITQIQIIHNDHA